MDKRTKSQQKLHLRQSERGLSLTAQLVDYDGTPYDLTGMLVRFKDAKAGGKSVSDDNVTVSTDPKTGVVTYPVHSQVFAADGIGWFEIYSNAVTLIDSTQNIVIKVEQDISGTIDNSDYISGLDGIKAQLQGIVNSAQQTLDNAVSGANTAASNANQAAQAAQTLANDIPNNPKYRGPVGPSGSQGYSTYLSAFQEIDNGIDYWWSDLGSPVSTDRPPIVGDIVISPDGTIRRIVSVVVGGNSSGGSFSVGPTIANIKGKDGKDGKDGTGIQLKGTVASVDKLPATGNTTGDTYLVQGHLYIWKDDVWTDGGELQGTAGESAYQVWLDAGNTGTEADFLASLIGLPGKDGKDGSDGQSAYQLWLDAGNTGTQADFLASLKGADGKDGTTPDLTPYLKSADAANTYQTPTQADAKYITQVSKTYSGDLNNLGTGGSYIIAPGLTNAPNATDYFFVSVQAQGTIADYGVNQIATDIATGEVYRRTKATGHGWTYWSHMVNTDTMQAALDAKTQLVADETTATSNSATNTTALYLVPEAS